MQATMGRREGVDAMGDSSLLDLWISPPWCSCTVSVTARLVGATELDSPTSCWARMGEIRVKLR